MKNETPEKNWFKNFTIKIKTILTIGEKTNDKIDNLEKTINHLNAKIVRLESQQKESQELTLIMSTNVEQLLNLFADENQFNEFESVDENNEPVYQKKYLN